MDPANAPGIAYRVFDSIHLTAQAVFCRNVCHIIGFVTSNTLEETAGARDMRPRLTRLKGY